MTKGDFVKIRMAALALCALLVLLAGCGGGGGGGGGSTQETTASGYVYDSANQDRPVFNATVRIGNGAAVTDAQGLFQIRNPTVGATTATVTPPSGSPQTVALPAPIIRGGNGPFSLTINIGQVRGRILLPDNSPAAGAFVTLVATGNSVTAGTDGTFRIDDVPQGANEITAILGTASATKQVTIVSGVTEIGDIKLVENPDTDPPDQPRTIQGTITLSDNASAANLTVELLVSGTVVETTRTDGAGKYSFYRPIGTYVVRATKTGYRLAQRTVNVTNPATPVTANLTLAKL